MALFVSVTPEVAIKGRFNNFCSVNESVREREHEPMLPKQLEEDELPGESQKRVISALAQSNHPLQIPKESMTGINTVTEAKAA
jgi:hypothetical protein